MSIDENISVSEKNTSAKCHLLLQLRDCVDGMEIANHRVD
jgi:hypothetical protein